MPTTICRADGQRIDITAALGSEANVLSEHHQYMGEVAFKFHLWQRRAALERLVALHVGVDAACVKTGHPKTWRAGSFNVAIPLLLFDCADAAEDQHDKPTETPENQQVRRVVLRCPLPMSCAETNYPGSILEKMRCEVASYVWMQRHCPEVRIPHLYGFGFPNSTPPMTKEPAKMRNLFRGISQIILALARIPQPRIGAFCFNDDGTISLDNRPLTWDIVRSENEGAPRTMAVDKTYTDVGQYVLDTMTFHDERFLAAPHAAHNEADCKGQMAIRAFLRAVAPRFVDNSRRNGPFALFMADQNATNIMVDSNWNVTGIFDLEWIVSAPIDMPHTPRWLTWEQIDCIAGEGYGEYDRMRGAFMEVFKEEERHADTSALEAAHGGTLSSILDASWVSKQVWFYRALLSSHAIDLLTERQLVPLHYPGEFPVPAVFSTWCTNPEETVAGKLADRRAYEERILKLFAQITKANDTAAS
ncbi:hypothetical protein SPBR_01580 [Sporothrix brasiliensis 5110]|uniref:Aminoglycoside phosphotransferase domain-containing protein n=1 Tax=Sporothrix brasiliensis 5110 TaxID=1398154 RepID=A0A0C2J279_9PEZI|nr:uncharacterized protein SPBR_01580 [Sporothrix brasiliensis 5110]KIH91177.1 hypothetical protein SPBR_01580 [Sporothrix brasiliensis 5110]